MVFDRVQLTVGRRGIPLAVDLDQATVLVALDLRRVAAEVELGILLDGDDVLHREVFTERQQVVDVAQHAVVVHHTVLDAVVGGAHHHAEPVVIRGDARVEGGPARSHVHLHLTDADTRREAGEAGNTAGRR